ncbi:MAG: porin family protein [Rubellimicrobium sp.]|nr:porin family protein [Rubellimicrobium sp.]
MFRPLLTACAALALAAPAFAGDLTVPVTEPALAAPVAAPLPPATDWSGFYLGAQTGLVDLDDAGTGYSGPVYGAHLGYLRDFGSLVAGGELRYDDISALRGVAGRVTVLTGELRLGYDMGRLLPYVAVGAARANNHDIGVSATGPVYGLGADFALSDQWRLGAEATHSDLGYDDGTASSFTATNLGLSVSFSF